MAYVVVLWIELSPAFLEKWQRRLHSAAAARGAHGAAGRSKRRRCSIIALGLLLPTMHQSSLGTLMLLAGSRLHPLWRTPLLPLLFLISCVSMGYAVVVFESAFSSVAFKRRPETAMLARLAARHRAAADCVSWSCGSAIWRGAGSSACCSPATARSVMATSRVRAVRSRRSSMLASRGTAPRSRPSVPRGDGHDVRRRAVPLRHLSGRVHARRALVVLPERAGADRSPSASWRSRCSRTSSSSRRSRSSPDARPHG